MLHDQHYKEPTSAYSPDGQLVGPTHKLSDKYVLDLQLKQNFPPFAFVHVRQFMQRAHVPDTASLKYFVGQLKMHKLVFKSKKKFVLHY